VKGTIRTAIVAASVITLLVAIVEPALAARPGRLDRTFNRSGKQSAFPRGASGFSVTLDASGRIIVAGYTLRGKSDIALARFLPNGHPDGDFGGGDGRVTTNLGGTDYGFDVAVSPDGDILVAGERDTRSGAKAALVRYRPRGGLDKDFGGGDGIVLTSFGKKFQGANAVVVGGGGNITIGGFTSNGSTGRWALARFGPRGALARSFGRDGKVTLDVSRADDQINDMVLVPGGKLVAVGTGASGLTPEFAIARFDPNGTLDRRFGKKRGINVVDVAKGADIPFGLAEGPTGKLVAVGLTANGGKDDWALVGFGAKGRLDQGFGRDGRRVIKLGPGFEFASAAAIQSNDRIVVAGRASRGNGDDFAVFRLRPNGAFDQTFGKNGRVFANFFGGSDTARDVVLQPNNGKIVAAGDATKGRTRRMAVARFIGR
jgi:uncharacterized delta-60 repeat protein